MNYYVPGIAQLGFHNLRRTNSFISTSNSQQSARQGALATDKNLAQPPTGRVLKQNLFVCAPQN
jgi:hypothetical protein